MPTAGPLPARATDYAHARHVGNVGDVFKHVTLAATLGAFQTPPVLYAESHAGDGLFTLGSVGEWTAGAARLWGPATGRKSVDAWKGVVESLSKPGSARPEKYPGSPLIAKSLLPASTRMVLHELDPNAAEVLRRALSGSADLRQSDGFKGLPEVLAAEKGPSVAMIDPPYTGKDEWTAAAECLEACRKAAPQATLLLWYPLKALTRPRALLADLTRRDLHGTLIELLSTPLRLKRDRLAGSGMIVLNPPAGALEEICAALPILGPPLATHGEWSSNLIGF